MIDRFDKARQLDIGGWGCSVLFQTSEMERATVGKTFDEQSNLLINNL